MIGSRTVPMTIELDVQNATAFEPLPDDVSRQLDEIMERARRELVGA